jgi:hypothetical protein
VNACEPRRPSRSPVLCREQYGTKAMGVVLGALG